jgi:hypothetical protein
VEIVMLPREPTSIIGTLLKAAGGEEEKTQVFTIPTVRAILRALPGSFVLEPDAPQARLPYQITIE